MPYYNGTAGNDEIAGTIDNDTLVGNKGNDTLSAGRENDTYVFNPGDGVNVIFDSKDDTGASLDKGDIIEFGIGITQDDLLFSRNGTDNITGGPDNDTFVIRPDPGSIDVVTDFEVTNPDEKIEPSFIFISPTLLRKEEFQALEIYKEPIEPKTIPFFDYKKHKEETIRKAHFFIERFATKLKTCPTLYSHYPVLFTSIYNLKLPLKDFFIQEYSLLLLESKLLY